MVKVQEVGKGMKVLELMVLVLALALYWANTAWGGEQQMLHGRVVYTDDGDTVVLLTQANTQVKIRLSSIDAPESSHTNHEVGRVGQPYANKATEFLASMVKGREVDARCYEADRYGREVCELLVDGLSANAEMVKKGWAWANTAANGRYLRDRSLIEAQASAQRNRLGLWAGNNPVPPWEWRKTCWQGGHCPQ